MQLLHPRQAMLLVKEQAFVRRQSPLARQRIVMKDGGQCLQYVTAFVGKAIHHIHKVPPGVGEAIAQNHPQRLGRIPRQRIAHLYRGRQFGGTLPQQIDQVLAGVLASREEQRHPLPGKHTHDPGSKQAGARVGNRALETQNPHTGVVVV